jgi:hypothetical protein
MPQSGHLPLERLASEQDRLLLVPILDGKTFVVYRWVRGSS